MTKDDFIATLKTSSPVSKDKMIAVCQYYIDNYALNIPEGMFIPYPLKISGGSDKVVSHAFVTLKSIVNEFLK